MSYCIYFKTLTPVGGCTIELFDLYSKAPLSQMPSAPLATNDPEGPFNNLSVPSWL